MSPQNPRCAAPFGTKGMTSSRGLYHTALFGGGMKSAHMLTVPFFISDVLLFCKEKATDCLVLLWIIADKSQLRNLLRKNRRKRGVYVS
ncbi:hypothetical protein AMELA_G00052470 [Ameiurus melas]|uniref:Uncharacterized protein n=1 Tax=Ameiurus melas TaxID=219545 RepID=A0A7J6B607_AMEME|nr:hypothetical protein AMELA_G00052470 [Ameiurus melas]